MASDSGAVLAYSSLEEAFPNVDPGVIPLGARVLVQLRVTKRKTAGGLFIVDETKETEKWNNQVAKVVALGTLAYCNRDTGKPWTEGIWVQPGDFVRIPRWGGDRVEVNVDGLDEPVVFAMFNDHEVIAKITGDPLSMRAFIL